MPSTSNVSSLPILLAVIVTLAHNLLSPMRVEASLSLLVTGCKNVFPHRLVQFYRPVRHLRYEVAHSIRPADPPLQSSTPNRFVNLTAPSF